MTELDPSPWLSRGFRELRRGVLIHPYDRYVRAVIGTTVDGRTDYVLASPYELASWVFPHEPEEDAAREALVRDLIEAIDGKAEPDEIARRWDAQNPDPLSRDIQTLVSRFRDAAPA